MTQVSTDKNTAQFLEEYLYTTDCGQQLLLENPGKGCGQYRTAGSSLCLTHVTNRKMLNRSDSIQ